MQLAYSLDSIGRNAEEPHHELTQPNRNAISPDIASAGARSLGLMLVTLALTGLACLLCATEFIGEAWRNWRIEDWPLRLERLTVGMIVSYLMLSSLIYYVMRVIAVRREKQHRRLGFSDLAERQSCNADDHPRIAILVPSYKEEIEVIRQTVLSAVLQGSWRRRVVLLLDDPVEPSDSADQRALALARALPEEIASLLHGALAPIDAAGNWIAHAVGSAEDWDALRQLWCNAANWFEEKAAEINASDHAQRLLRDRVLLARAADLRRHAAQLGVPYPVEQAGPQHLAAEYRRLRAIFSAELTVFERKSYANLAHDANKAMNLNAYIHLVGKSWDVVEREGRRFLEIRPDQTGCFRAEEADFVIVLDADSLLVPNYADLLVDFMARPENARVAIVQSPYASISHAPSALERIAGAQTDAMYWSHQGLTAIGAASWVGAAAMLRLNALRETVETAIEKGILINRYVKDRTVTEDADTTIDLLLKGWQVHNYPERLCFSATPADFGAFLIQRRRWATGGMLILPKLMRYFGQAPGPRRVLEVGLRAQYLLSGSIGSLAMLLLIFYPWKLSNELSPGLIVPVVLFTSAQVIEIRQLGQRKRDVISFYALNLLLVPINLSGMWHSLKQLATGQRGSFGRTPKVVRRTSVPRHHVIAPLMLLAAFTGKIGYYFLVSQSWPGVVGAASLGLIMLYGLSRFMGWSHILADLAVQHDVLRGNPQCALRQVASLVLLREAASQSEGVS